MLTRGKRIAGKPLEEIAQVIKNHDKLKLSTFNPSPYTITQDITEGKTNGGRLMTAFLIPPGRLW